MWFGFAVLLHLPTTDQHREQIYMPSQIVWLQTKLAMTVWLVDKGACVSALGFEPNEGVAKTGRLFKKSPNNHEPEHSALETLNNTKCGKVSSGRVVCEFCHLPFPTHKLPKGYQNKQGGVEKANTGFLRHWAKG